MILAQCTRTVPRPQSSIPPSIHIWQWQNGNFSSLTASVFITQIWEPETNSVWCQFNVCAMAMNG